MKDNLYVIGIPTSENLVNQELLDFINEKVPTIYLNHLGRVNDAKNTFGEYNFFVQNNFIDGFLSSIELTEQLITENKVLIPCPGLLPKSRESTSDQLALKFLEQCLSVRSRFPSARIAYLTHGSPYLYSELVINILEVESNFNINVIDCTSCEDNNINDFFKVSVILGQEEFYKPYLKKQIPPYDRSGIFFNNTSPTIPINTYTNKSFTQITDETALSYEGKDVLIAWSGGIDSSTVVAAFVKNNVPFKVTVNTSSEAENKQLYDYLISNHNVITIKENEKLFQKINLTELDSSCIIVTGDCADQLYPGIHHNFIPGGIKFKELVGHKDFDVLYKKYFDTEVEEIYLRDNVRQSFIEWYVKHFKCDTERGEDIYDNYLLPHIKKFPFDVKHYYQLVWFFKFIFKYETTAKEQFYRFAETNNEVRAFFDTQEFQRWAITNLDYNFNTYSTHYNDYKMFQKQYSYDVFGLESLLKQTKYPSFY